MKREARRLARALGLLAVCLSACSGCASMRARAPSLDWRPCTEGWAYTKDGWRLGIRHIRPAQPDPGKLPVVLCHGLGLNGTFWTITKNHLPQQLAERGYEVYIFDFRGSGESSPLGRIGRLNARLRQTPFLELREGRWTVDDIVRYDVPAVLDYVKNQTGKEQVNWVGHSLGGMLVFPYLETSAEASRIATFVGMGSTITLANAPDRDMLRANRGLRVLARVVSPGRLGRPLMYFRFPGLDRIDQFYYTSANVDRATIERFYGYTLEDTGRSALRQLDPYLEFGHFVSADRKIDYALRLSEVTTPTLLIAGDADIMSDVPSTELTFNALSSQDKTLLQFGKKEGHVADYGHCDLVWSRYAPKEVFPPVINWLDSRQPGIRPSAQEPKPSPQAGRSSPQQPSGEAEPAPPLPSLQKPFDADLRPGLELVPITP